MTQSWDRWAILAEIKRRGTTLVAISTEAGLSRSACGIALGNPNHPSADKAISEFLGVPLYELFPDRYFPNGERRIKKRPYNKRSRNCQASQCKTEQGV